MAQSKTDKTYRKVLLQRIAALIALLLCVVAAVSSARAGLSRLMSEYGAATNSLPATERAIVLNVADPEAHYSYASLLAAAAKPADAVAEYDQAVALRPQDYFFWQELGRAQDESGDANGAIASFRQATKLAPNYSLPHWLLGNVLLRENQFEEAFEELRLAVESDPSLFPQFIDLAWGMNHGDSTRVLAITKPHTDKERIELVRYFLTHDRLEAGLSLMPADMPREDRLGLVSTLIDSGRIEEAHKIWQPSGTAHDLIFDGGFDGPISSDERAFGWKPIPLTRAVQIALDTNLPHSGKQSLRVEYSGVSDSIISQLVPVASQARYRLMLFARTQDLASAALPIVAISDIAGQQVIAHSRPLARGTADWQELSIDFETADVTSVVINIRREACSSQPCPIFGGAWFDDFSMHRLDRKQLKLDIENYAP